MNTSSIVGRMAGALLLGGAAASAQAVRLNGQGEGQALIFPYYTTAAGNSTLLTLSNYTLVPKVVQLRFAESEHGRTALALNIYLAGADSWTAALVDRGADRAPELITRDDSCTFPLLSTTTTLPNMPSDLRYGTLALATPDAGSAGESRLREGFIEAVELATIPYGTTTANALRPGETSPPNCALIADYWTLEPPQGRWRADPLADLRNPTGGLSGEVAIINVANGTVYVTAPTAIDDYRTDPQDQPRGTLATTARHTVANRDTASLLVHALNDPETGTAIAHVVADGRNLSLSYPPGRAVDAVSAVLTASQLQAPLEEDPPLGARSTYVLTYPTRALYADPALSGSATPLPPFGTLLAGPRALGTGPSYRVLAADRRGFVQGFDGCNGLPGCQPTVARTTGTALETVAPGGSPDPLLGTRLNGNLGKQVPNSPGNSVLLSGWLMLDLANAANPLRGEPLRPSLDGWRLLGVPVIGTRLQNYVNANVTAGVLANYSAARPMTARTRCVDAAGNACP